MSQNRTPHERLDPRRPLVLDLRELGRRPGSMRSQRLSVPAPHGWAVQPIRVPEGAVLDLDLRLEAVMEGVFVSGTVQAQTEGECVRCLSPVADEVVSRVDELFAYPDSRTEETTEEDEVRRIEGDFVDLEPAVRDVVVLALPLAPLCRTDCHGLCPTCGQRLDDLPADHTHETIDPRWAALAERFAADAPGTPGRHDSQES